MKMHNSDGYQVSLQLCEGKIPHKIDDNPLNKLSKPAVIYLPEDASGNLRVMHSNGNTTTYKGFAGQYYISAVKIWATGTTIDHNQIFFAR